MRNLRLYPVLTLIIILGWLLAFALDIERYPITTYPMYSDRDTSGIIHYWRVYEVHADNTLRPASPAQHVPLSEVRWRKLLPDCLAETPYRCAWLFRAAYGDQPEITAIRVEQWAWDFRHQPGSRGQVVRQVDLAVR